MEYKERALEYSIIKKESKTKLFLKGEERQKYDRNSSRNRFKQTRLKREKMNGTEELRSQILSTGKCQADDS